MNLEIEVLTDTITHINHVRDALAQMRSELERRGINHDRSKLEEVEFDAFVKARPKFKKADYGSPEYEECTREIKPAIDHHYELNRHHVAYHHDGFAGMNLLDILEMLADWKAANLRSMTLSLEDSLPITFKQYNIPENMQRHITATLLALGWIDP